MLTTRAAGLMLALLLLAPPASAQFIPPDELAGAKAVELPTLRPSDPSNVAIASNGTGFVAVWNDRRYGAEHVFGVALDPDGRLVDQIPSRVSGSVANDGPVALVPNGGDYALFSRTNAGGTRIVGIGADGSAVARKTIALQPLGAAWNGSRHAVAFAGDSRALLQLRYYDRDFNEAGSTTFGYTGGEQRSAAVAAGEGRFLVTWVDTTGFGPSPGRRTYAQLFDDRGNAVGQLREIAAAAWDGGPSAAPAASWNGSSFVVVCAEAGRIAVTVISRTGEVEKSFVIDAAPWAGSHALAWDGRVHLAVWQDKAALTYEAAVISSTGDLLDRFRIASGASLARPAVAANGDRFVVLAGRRTVAVRPAALERTADRGAFPLAYLSQMGFAITAGASHLLMAWTEGGEVYASRISPGGGRIRSSIALGTVPSNGPFRLTAASAGDLHLVAWPAGGTKIRAALLGGSDERRDVEITDGFRDVVAASSGNDFALFWSRYRQSTSTPATLMMSSVAKDGEVTSRVIGTAPIEVEVLTTAWTGAAYGLYWRRDVSPVCVMQICPAPLYEHHLMRISPDGRIASDAVVPSRTVIASMIDSQGLVVAYSQRQNQSTELVIERTGFDGTTVSTVRSLAATKLPTGGSLIRTDTGYALVGSYFDASAGRSAVVTMLFDAGGRLLQAVERNDENQYDSYGALGAFGSIWTAHAVRFRPPDVQDAQLYRMYFRTLMPRTRAFRR